MAILGGLHVMIGPLIKGCKVQLESERSVEIRLRPLGNAAYVAACLLCQWLMVNAPD